MISGYISRNVNGQISQSQHLCYFHSSKYWEISLLFLFEMKISKKYYEVVFSTCILKHDRLSTFSIFHITFDHNIEALNPMLQIVPKPQMNNFEALDNIFSDDDDKFDKKTKKKNSIKSLGDVLNDISNLSESLKKIKKNHEFSEIKFIPENEVTEELNQFMKEYEKERKLSLFDSLNSNKYSMNIQLQIKLLRSLLDNSVCFDDVPDHIDSRVASLVHWKISQNQTKNNIKCYYLLHALLEFVNTSEPAPISVFFLEFNISNMIFHFCQATSRQFADSPFLETVLQSLSPFSNDPNAIISMINNAGDHLNHFEDLSDDDDDDDDDEFNDLKPMSKASSPPLIKMKTISIENPLANLEEKRVPPKIPDSPSPVTFRFFRKAEKSSPDQFLRWLIKHHCKLNDFFDYSSPFVQNNNSTISLNDATMFTEIYEKMFQTDVRPLIPKTIKPVFFSLFMPIIHHINSSSNEFFSNGLDQIFLPIIENEYNAHVGLFKKNQKLIDASFSFFTQPLSKNQSIKINPLSEKRPFPPKEIKIDNELLSFIKLIDYALISESRSPITLLPSSLPPQKSNFTKIELAEAIFNLYTKQAYPPYISFRAAFTLGLLLCDKNFNLAIDFIYEGIFLVMHFYPQLNSSVYIQSAFYLMGELFYTVNKYYFCSICIDNTLQICSKNHALAAKVGSFAMKNSDSVRSVFFYLLALKQFIQSKQKEEIMYITQIVASIYVEHDLIVEAIQLMSYIIGLKLDSGDSVNVVNVISRLCKLCCSKCWFEEAKNFVGLIDVSTPSMSRIVSRLNGIIYISQNKFREYYESIKPILSFPNNALPPQMVVKEIILPTLKSLSKSYVSGENFISALFWCEIGCHVASSINAAKEVCKFFLLRGTILYIIYYSMYLDTITISNSALDQLALSFGMFSIGPKLFKVDILKEALGSLAIAISLYERFGNVSKLLNARILYIQLICSYLLPQENPILKIQNPGLFTSFKISTASSSPLKTFDYNILIEDNDSEIKGPDQYVQACKSIQTLANSFYDPLLISRSEALSSVIFFLKDDLENAKTMMDHSLSNLRQFFFKGTKFIVSNCKIWFTFKLSFFLRFLLTFLIYFPDDFIQKRLFLFDMMNDVSILLNYQKNSTITQAKIPIEPKIDFTSSIFSSLDDSFWPKFNGIIPPNEKKKISISQKIFSLYIRICKNEVILEDNKISSANKKIVYRIQNLKKKQVIPEFSTIPNSLYIFISSGEIGVYIPFLNSKRFISLAALRKPSFIDGIRNMVDWSTEQKPFSEEFLNDCLIIGKALFGSFDNFTKFIMKEYKDTNDFGIKFNSLFNRGSLYSLTPPQSALVVITDHMLQFLPFEFFIPPISLTRRLNSDKRENHKYTLRPIIFRNKIAQNFVDYRKMKLVEVVTSELPIPVNAIESEGAAVFPFPLFNPAKQTINYLQIFEFFDVIPIYPNNLPNLTDIKNALFILTFSDLVALPDFLFQLIDTIPKACFIFVPTNHVSVVLHEMKRIFERHLVRKNYIDKNKNSDYYKLASRLFKDKFAFMTTLQMTLMRKLNIPVAIISPESPLR